MPTLRFFAELLTFALLIATVYGWSIVASALSGVAPMVTAAL